MPRTLMILFALVVAGCQTDNPVFMVGTAGNDGGASTGEAPGTTTGGPAPTGETGVMPSTSTGPDPTTGRPDTEATTAVDPSTTTGGAATSTGGESTSTGGESTSTGEASTSSGEESSTGDAECDYGDTPYQKLYPLCDAPGTTWMGGSMNDYNVDCGSGLMQAKVLPHELVVAGPFMQEYCEVFELVPEPANGGHVEGVFEGLTLAPNQAMDAEFFTAALCVTPEMFGTCDLQASVWVSYEGNMMALPVTKQVKNGASVQLTIPLFMIPGVGQGEPFNLHMKLAINGSADAMDRAYFIAPRIRKKGG